MSTLTPLRPIEDDLAAHDAPHPSGGDRYAIYIVDTASAFPPRLRRRLAETSVGGIGTTLVTLHDEGEITDNTRVGILDRETREWIVNPWARGEIR